MGASFQVLGVPNKELDKKHRKGSENVYLLKAEKKYTLQNESGMMKRLTVAPRIKERGVLYPKFLDYHSYK